MVEIRGFCRASTTEYMGLEELERTLKGFHHLDVYGRQSRLRLGGGGRLTMFPLIFQLNLFVLNIHRPGLQPGDR